MTKTKVEVKRLKASSEQNIGDLLEHVETGIIGMLCRHHPEFKDRGLRVLCFENGYTSNLYNYVPELWRPFYGTVTITLGHDT